MDISSLFNKKRKCANRKGQVVIEFTFSMIVVLLMIYAVMMVFLWAGRDMGARQQSHEVDLRRGVSENYGSEASGPAGQLDPFFYRTQQIDASWSPGE